MRRFFAISAVAMMAIVVLAFIALHTPPVQSRILGWSIEELERRYSVTAFPTLVVASSDGRLLAKVEGYGGPDRLRRFLEESPRK